MDVIVNGPLRIVVNPQIYNYSVSTSWETNYLTNTFAISNSFAQLAGDPVCWQCYQSTVCRCHERTDCFLVHQLRRHPVCGNHQCRLYRYHQCDDRRWLCGHLHQYKSGAVVTPYPLRLIIFNDGTNATLLQRVYYGINQNSNIVATTQESCWILHI